MLVEQSELQVLTMYYKLKENSILIEISQNMCLFSMKDPKINIVGPVTNNPTSPVIPRNPI